MSDPLSFDPTSGCIELHDEVVDMYEVNGELRAFLADGSYYVIGVTDQHKVVVHLGRDLLNS